MTLPALLDFERQVMPQILPEADLSNWEELADEPIDAVFDTGLVTGTMGLLIAPGGTGKSYLALQLALSVALGKSLLPGFTPMRRGPVLCCFGEDDRHELARRLKAICNAHNIDPSTVTTAIREGRLFFILGKAEALLQFNIGGTAILSEAHEELTRRCTEREYRLVVVDPIVGWAGVPNENDNSQMQLAAQALVELAKACGGAVLGVHHQGKQSSHSRDTSVATGRGATSLTDASRWQATLRPLDASNKFGIAKEDLPRYVELHIGKNSYFERDGRPLYLKRHGGALVAVNLTAKPEDALAKLARALADKIGPNKDNLPKWSFLGEGGQEFRREFKAEHGPNATKANVAKGYAMALERGWLIEDTAPEGAGDNAKIPRNSPDEEAE